MRHVTVSWTSARELSDDIHDDMTDLHTTPYHMSYLPMSSLTLSIPYPVSDRCDTTTGVPVSIEKVSPWHQQVQSRARVVDDPTASHASGSWNMYWLENMYWYTSFTHFTSIVEEHMSLICYKPLVITDSWRYFIYLPSSPYIRQGYVYYLLLYQSWLYHLEGPET